VNWEMLSVLVGIVAAYLLYKHSSGGGVGSTVIQGAAMPTVPTDPAAPSNIGPSPIAGNTPYVANWWDTLYQTVDQRAVNADGSYGDPGGQAFWASETATKGQAVATAEFLATPEAAVESDYGSSLGRSADPGGLKFYTNEIQSGADTNAQVAAQIANSPEAKARVAAANHA
jgi:hypothetical protein